MTKPNLPPSDGHTPHGDDTPVRPADRAHARSGLSRRSFLKGAGGAAAASSVLSAATAAQEGATATQGATTLSGTVEVELTINGQVRKVSVEPRTTLLSALRDRLEPALTGAKLVCDMGSCGACTVLVDGKPAYGCLTLAVQCRGKAITTVEGFGEPEAMSDVQDAFCEKDGLMCGFCTPGFVVATHAALDRNPDASLDELKYELSGNLCRCGTYPHVFEAAQLAQASRAAASEGSGSKEGGR
ncbi:MAG: (2Fe-2S)-binding protein [Planctomycetota bacterium]